jgi:hypothetical protein
MRAASLADLLDFLPLGRTKVKSPLGGQQAEGAAWGDFLTPIGELRG